ncbi:MAG: sulfurtransferase-like selenium metabolism protein YedF [Anaerolineales bacterium]|nr:sulfurtransferase-like selenium metabolism protein YedF [Anaerolineales bacterium]
MWYARSLWCLTKKALENTDEVTTIVDNDVAKDNVSKLAQSAGCNVNVEQKDDGIYLMLKKQSASSTSNDPRSTAGTVVFIGSEIIGRGENTALGSLLMQSFLHTVGEFKAGLQTIIMMNNGVKLATSDSPTLGELQQMEKQGVEILVCGTCLDRLGLMDKVATGQVSNMYTITETMIKASKVISL